MVETAAIVSQMMSRNFRNDDPYNLKDYASNVVPPDGGKAPTPKTAEPPTYYDNRIYVSNIPFSFRDNDLVELFSRFGKVHAAMIVCNERGSKGFGFVTMDSIESCERARANLNGTRILGRVIEVRKATPLSKPQRPAKKYITNNPAPSLPHLPSTPRNSRKTFSKPIVYASPSVRSQQQQPPPQQQQPTLHSQFGSENPVMLQNFLAPMTGGFVSSQQPQFFTPMVSSALIAGALQQYTPSVPPLLQSQSGFAYTISSIQSPQLPFDTSGAFPGVHNFISNDVAPPPSLNNTMNQTLLSTSMSTHYLQMQDQLVDMLNLDGTMNTSKFIKHNSLNGSFFLNSSSEKADAKWKQYIAGQPLEA